ncbi:MAG: hypothetical protein JXA33_02120 [Anaerolineae bacterium]|nr:hypothetical protein [Anaerolineae bacterium]
MMGKKILNRVLLTVGLFVLMIMLLNKLSKSEVQSECLEQSPGCSQHINDACDSMEKRLPDRGVISPGYSLRALPGETLAYTHTLSNETTVTDTFILEAASSLAWPLTLLVSQVKSTVVLPVTLGPGMSATVGVSMTVPTLVMSGTVAHTIITATSMVSASLFVTATDVTHVYRVPGISLSPSQHRESIPGGRVYFTHVFTNTGPVTDSFTVSAVSARGWEVIVRDAAQQTIQVPLMLGELETAAFSVQVDIPPDTVVGDLDYVGMTVTSVSDVEIAVKVTDTLLIITPVKIFLPFVCREEIPLAKLGADVGHIITQSDVLAYDFPVIKEMGITWARVPLSWLSVEVSPGVYKWDDYDPVFARLQELGMQAIVIVFAPPDWAAEENCGPISDTLALENFLDLVVSRYADVAGAWEFVNEPDGARPHHYGPVIGCWGYYPEAYAQHLGIFNAKVKQLDPTALVFFGGLAYDAWDIFVRDFFDKALQYGAGQYFDGVSLHYYPINQNEFPTMAHKVNEIYDTMARNGVYQKRIWVTETGMWVNDVGVPEIAGSVEKQRDFIAKNFARGFGAGVDNIFWFDIAEHPLPDNAVHRWLIGAEHQPINGYTTYQTFAQQIGGLFSRGIYTEVPEGIEAYEFGGEKYSVYVLWSNVTTQTVSLPAANAAVLTSRDGDFVSELPVVSGTVTFEVGLIPLFVKLY